MHDNRKDFRISRRSFFARLKLHFTRTDLKVVPPQEINKKYRLIRPEIDRLYSRSELWHGTGRFRYLSGTNRQDALVLDILKQILQSGGLQPASDDWDFTQGRMQSISMTPNRMYARIYSQFYQGPESKVSYQYGDRSRWSTYFMYPTFLNAVLEYLKLRGRKLTIEEFIRRPAAGFWQWAAKINRRINGGKTLPFGYFSSITSDIPDNYGIIIGIKKNAANPIKTASFLARYERRTRERIPISRFSHIEVPFQKFEPTQALLKQMDRRLPVIPIECGDIFCSQFSLRRLKSPSVMEKKPTIKPQSQAGKA